MPDATADEPHLESPLTPQELEWRLKLQPVLAHYEPTWNCFDQLWHCLLYTSPSPRDS